MSLGRADDLRAWKDTTFMVEIPPNVPPEMRASAVIGYATGQVVRQADCEVIEAFDRLAERAKLLGQTLEHTALDVLDGIIRFDQ